MCEARANGHTPSEIRREIGRCLGDEEVCDCEYLKFIVENQITVMIEALAMLALMAPMLRLMPAIMRLARLLGGTKYLPGELKTLTQAQYDQLVLAAERLPAHTRLMEGAKAEILTARATAFDIGKGAEVIIKPKK